MPNSHTKIYVHLVWATWDRKPYITEDIEDALYTYVRSRCRDMQAHIHALGGVQDHIHLLIRMPTTLSIADIVKDIKGASSHYVSKVLGHKDFRWQGAYSAFSVCHDGIDAVCDYINDQKIHHSRNTLDPQWEE